MKRITILPLLLFCHLLIAQSYTEADFPATDLIEVAKYQKFANPKIIGHIGDTDYVLLRKLAKSGEIRCKLTATSGRTLVKEIKLESSSDGIEYFTNGRVYSDKILLFGYRYGEKMENAQIFYKVFDANLNPLGEDHIVSQVALDDDWLKIGTVKNQMTNLGAISVAPAIFSSEIYDLDDGTYEVWFSSLSYRSGAETKDTPFLTKIILDESGLVKSRTMLSTEQSGETDFNLAHEDVYDLHFHKLGPAMFVHIEECSFSIHSGQNVYDDYRFPYVSNFRTAVLKFEDDKLVAHLDLGDYNYQTSTLIDSGQNLHLIGFYGKKFQTLWTGAYSIKLDYQLQPQSKEYLPIKGNFQHEELQGEKAYTMPALAKVSQGIMRNPHVEVFEDGSMALLGELTTQIIQERSPFTNDFIKLGDDKYGKRVTSGFTPDRVHSVKHYYNKIVVLGLDNSGHYSGKVEVINKKQFGLGVRPDKIGYSCTGNGEKLTIRFNESRKALKKGYFDKKGGYKSEVKKDQILQEYRFDSNLNFEHIVYPNRGEKTIIPKATSRTSNSWRELYTDEKRYYLFAKP